MSVQALGWVLDHSPTKGSDRLVLLSIANHAGTSPVDGAWEAWPGTATLQREARLDRERTVKDALARLVEAGAIERVVNGAPDDRVRKDRRTNLYRIQLDNGVTCDDTPCVWCGVTPNVTRSGERGDASRPDGVTLRDRNGGPTPSLTEPVIEPASDVSDAARLCGLLADLIEANGSKRPNVSETWVRDMDRMLRLDSRTPEQVENCIRWSQADEFWRANILSPSKLRAKYDQLRLQAIARRSGNGRSLDPVGAHKSVMFDDEGALVT